LAQRQHAGVDEADGTTVTALDDCTSPVTRTPTAAPCNGVDVLRPSNCFISGQTRSLNSIQTWRMYPITPQPAASFAL
jgi:hypothetical protein